MSPPTWRHDVWGRNLDQSLKSTDSRAQERLFVVQRPIRIHDRIHSIGESCRSKIYCLNPCCEIFGVQGVGLGHHKIASNKRKTYALANQNSEVHTNPPESVRISFTPTCKLRALFFAMTDLVLISPQPVVRVGTRDLPFQRKVPSTIVH